MGLLVIGFLSIFMVGANSNKEPELISKRQPAHEEPVKQAPPKAAPKPNTSKRTFGLKQRQAQQKQMAPNQAAQASQVQPHHIAIKPHEAEEFVKWWMVKGMDYQAHSAQKNRDEAVMWMTEEAANSFQASFWTPELKQGITNGTVVAGFQPVSVQATAVNPDGSIVVHVKGSLAMQIHGQPASTEHLLTDYLVKKESEGFRIAAVHNKTFVQAQAPTQHYYY